MFKRKIERKIDRASECSFCDSTWKCTKPVIVYESGSGLYSAVCIHCGSSAIPAKKYRRAIKNWNKRLYYDAVYEKQLRRKHNESC